jgi:hypothetical protein
VSNPIPHGTIGRTDQGVDISATPGAAIYDPVPGTSRVVGTIANWYQGQPYQWFKVLTGKFQGRYWSQAEQINPSLKTGQTVSQGQRIGTYAAKGTGTEFGWSTASGATLAHATGGYTEGQVTPAGSSFRSQIINGRTSPVRTAATTGPVPSYVPAKYRPWVRSAATGTGLPASVVAAQINNESGFDPNATSPTGAQGIAQFEPGTWKSQHVKGSPYNPTDALAGYNKLMSSLLNQYNGNIRDALAAYNAGPGNLAAGYGYADSILSKAGLPRTSSAGSPSTTAAMTRPGGDVASTTPGSTTPGSSSGSGIDGVLTDYQNEVRMARTAPSGFTPASQAGWTAPFQWWWQSFSGNIGKETGANG